MQIQKRIHHTTKILLQALMCSTAAATTVRIIMREGSLFNDKKYWPGLCQT